MHGRQSTCNTVPHADASPEEPDLRLPFILEKMHSAPASSDLSSSFSLPDSSLYSPQEGKEWSPTSLTPVPAAPLEQVVQDSGVVCPDTIVADGEGDMEEGGGDEQMQSGKLVSRCSNV